MKVVKQSDFIKECIVNGCICKNDYDVLTTDEPYLSTLYLKSLELTRLDNLPCIIQAEIIDLSGNKLKNIIELEDVKIIDRDGSPSILKKLDLSYNNIVDLSPAIHLARHIECMFNKVREIPDTTGTELYQLDLQSNCITVIDKVRENLSVLNMSYNPINECLLTYEEVTKLNIDSIIDMIIATPLFNEVDTFEGISTKDKFKNYLLSKNIPI